MPDLDLRLFRYFVVLAEERHFALAAERLSITPPTLTHQIKALEARLGVRLCHRKTEHAARADRGGTPFPRAGAPGPAPGRGGRARRAAGRPRRDRQHRDRLHDVGRDVGPAAETCRRVSPRQSGHRRQSPAHADDRRRSRRSSKASSTSASRGRRPTIRPSSPASRCSPSRWWWRCRATIALARRKRIAAADLKDEPFITIGAGDRLRLRRVHRIRHQAGGLFAQGRQARIRRLWPAELCGLRLRRRRDRKVDEQAGAPERRLQGAGASTRRRSRRWRASIAATRPPRRPWRSSRR